ncbi:MAG: 50S ribosomal protein L11 methyltransferase [Saprospiraceae bacterium]|nr:50S ribosomal protein L11 methyltransferase [Saprospiraceae bacterium]
MNYYEVEITPMLDGESMGQYVEEKIEILIAVLSDLPFDTFEEMTTSLKAFMREEDWNESVVEQLDELSLAFHFSYKTTHVPYQNWNEVWESNFQPIKVDDFVGLRADFHPDTEGVVFDLVINPKMAFGTGHHETTYMMMQLMRDLDFEGQKVLDYGCGTGVLAILASKLGATVLEAVDIEVASYDNTIENCAINGVENVATFCGTLDAVPSSDFDIILANINRNVILYSLNDLKNRLKKGGIILFSGFLKQDENILLEATRKEGFSHLETKQRGNWISMKYKL